MKQVGRVPLRCNKVAVGDRNRQGVSVVNVVDRPGRLGISVSSREQGDPDIGARHRVGETPSGIWIWKERGEVEFSTGGLFAKNALDLKSEIAGRHNIAKAPPSPAGFFGEQGHLIVLLLRALCADLYRFLRVPASLSQFLPFVLFWPCEQSAIQLTFGILPPPIECFWAFRPTRWSASALTGSFPREPGATNGATCRPSMRETGGHTFELARTCISVFGISHLSRT